MIKSFLALAVIALVLGTSLGGAFVGGSIYGQATASNDAGNDAGAPLGGEPGFGQTQRGGQTQAGPGGVPQGRQARQGGALGQGGQTDNGDATAPADDTQPANAPNVPEVQAGPGSGAGADRTLRSGGATGIVEKIEDGTLTIRTAEGPVTVIMSEDTRVATLSPAEIADLTIGATAVAIGRRDADGVAAAAVIVNPSGLDIPLLSGPARNRRAVQGGDDAPDGGGNGSRNDDDRDDDRDGRS